MFYQPANIYRRIGAAIIDHLLINLLLLALYAKYFQLPLDKIQIDQKTFIIFLSITLAYFFILEYFFHKTIGKKIFNLEVRQSNHYPLTIWGALMRNLFRPVDLIGFYFVAMVMITITGKSQRFGDLAGQTVVVQSI